MLPGVFLIKQQTNTLTAKQTQFVLFVLGFGSSTGLSKKSGLALRSWLHKSDRLKNLYPSVPPDYAEVGGNMRARVWRIFFDIMYALYTVVCFWQAASTAQ